MIASSSASPYLHPEQHAAHGDSTGQASAASPLALLAQTCSAIGKDSSPKQLMPALGKITGGCDDVGGCSARRPASFGVPTAVAAAAAATLGSGVAGGSRPPRASPERPPSADLSPIPRARDSASPAGGGSGIAVRPLDAGGERRKSLSPADGQGRPQSLTSAAAHRKQAARESRHVRVASAVSESSVPVSYAAQALAATQASLPLGLTYASLYQHWLPYFGQLCAAEAIQQQQQQQLSRNQAEKAAYSAAAAAAAALSHPSPVHGPCRDLGCLACRLGSHAHQLSPPAQQQHTPISAANNVAAAAAAAAASASISEHYVPGCPCCVDKLRGATTSPPFAPPPLNASAAAAAAAFLAAVRSPPQPVTAPSTGGPTHTCHWVSGAEYCGQQFASLDDLLLHVKTHAASDASVAAGAVQRTSPIALPSTPTPLATTYARAAAALAAAAAAPPQPPSLHSSVAASLGVGPRAPQHAHSARLHPYAKQYHSGGSSASGSDAKHTSTLPVDLSSSLSYLSSSPYAALFGAGGLGSAASR